MGKIRHFNYQGEVLPYYKKDFGIDAGDMQNFKEKVDQYNFICGGGVGMKMFASYFNMELCWYCPIYNPYKVKTQNVYFSFGASVWPPKAK